MSADGYPPTVYDIFNMRPREKILKEFDEIDQATTNFRSTNKLYLEVLLDIRDALLLKQV